MNKIPRFMKEYASYQIKSMNKYPLMAESVKAKAYQRITNAQSLYHRGVITVDEAMKMICEYFGD